MDAFNEVARVLPSTTITRRIQALEMIEVGAHNVAQVKRRIALAYVSKQRKRCLEIPSRIPVCAWFVVLGVGISLNAARAALSRRHEYKATRIPSDRHCDGHTKADCCGSESTH
jgi:hypothetical protein